MRFLSDILAKAGLTVDGVVTFNSVAKATVDTDKFVVIDNGVVKYRTGSELLSDIGGVSTNIYVSDGSLTSNRTVNLNGFTLSFSEDLLINGLRLGRGPGGAVNNVAFGFNALRDNVLSGGQNGTRNTAIGREALASNTSGFTNTAVGEGALRLLSSGTDNTAVGSTCLSAITSGSRNVSIGSHTGIILSGSSNIFIGVFSGGTALTSGSTNIFIGNHQNSGISGNANNNTFIGSGFTGLTADLSNNIIIGDGSGNQRIRVFSNGNVVIGQSSPVDAGFRLDVSGTMRVQSTLKVGANTSQAASAVLDIESTTQGVLLPRMTTTQRNAISGPATGLIVYDTTDNEFDYFNGTTWTPIRDTNIYNSDGTLTSSRTVTMGNNSLTFRTNAQSFRITNISDGTSTSIIGATMSIGPDLYIDQNQILSGRNGFRIGTSFPNQNFDLHASGSTRIRLFSSGNVGINTTTDWNFRLDVNGTFRTVGDATIATDIIISRGGGTRYIQSPNGSIGFLSSDGTGYTLWSQHNNVGVQGSLTISHAGFTAQNLTSISLSTSSTQASATGFGYELLFNPRVNHVSTLVAIRGGDSNYGGNSTGAVPIYIFGGQNTTSGSFGDIYLQHDFTGDRGSVGVGTNSIVASAKFQVNSTTKGILIPRMTSTQRDAITSPATGLEIYNTSTNVFNYYNGTSWVFPLVANVNFVSDYDYDITGSRNSVNKVFTLRNNYLSGTTRVFINGVRLTLGASYDYVETAPNQITFTNAPDNGDLITVDYIRN